MKLMRQEIGSERRRHPRYVLPSMYTAVAVRRAEETEFHLAGHAYDVSVGGMRFELDEAIEPGTSIGIRLELPGAASLRLIDRRPVHIIGNVVWLEEDDLDTPGPVRMACVFRRFPMPGDKERLAARLRSGRFSLAA